MRCSALHQIAAVPLVKLRDGYSTAFPTLMKAGPTRSDRQFRNVPREISPRYRAHTSSAVRNFSSPAIGGSNGGSTHRIAELKLSDETVLPPLSKTIPPPIDALEHHR